jgi:hypothetical protein
MCIGAFMWGGGRRCDANDVYGPVCANHTRIDPSHARFYKIASKRCGPCPRHVFISKAPRPYLLVCLDLALHPLHRQLDLRKPVCLRVLVAGGGRGMCIYTRVSRVFGGGEGDMYIYVSLRDDRGKRERERETDRQTRADSRERELNDEARPPKRSPTPPHTHPTTHPPIHPSAHPSTQRPTHAPLPPIPFPLMELVRPQGLGCLWHVPRGVPSTCKRERVCMCICVCMRRRDEGVLGGGQEDVRAPIVERSPAFGK